MGSIVRVQVRGDSMGRMVTAEVERRVLCFREKVDRVG